MFVFPRPQWTPCPKCGMPLPAHEDEDSHVCDNKRIAERESVVAFRLGRLHPDGRMMSLFAEFDTWATEEKHGRFSTYYAERRPAMNTEQLYTTALGRHVTVRTDDDSSDRQVWADTFTGLYHVPPEQAAGAALALPGSPLWPLDVVDFGCNIGLTTAHYKALYPWARVTGIEMDAASWSLAVRNAPDARILHQAVGGQPGIGYYNPNLRAEAYALTDPRPGFRAVPVNTLDRTLESIDPAPANLVKLDVKGAEWDIFDAAADWRPLVQTLLVELHPANDLPDDSDTLVTEAVRRLTAGGYAAGHHPPHPRAVWAVRVS